MARAHDSQLPAVAVWCNGQRMVARLRQYTPRITAFRLLLEQQLAPLTAAGAVLYVVPASAVPTLLDERGRVRLLAFAYGPPSALTTAFLHGCADYLREPWTATELELRVLRWLQGQPDRRGLAGGELRLSDGALHGPRGRSTLTIHELRVLDALLAAGGKVLDREVLYYRLWGRQPRHNSRAVDVHVAAIRRKARQAGATTAVIRTVRGEGYAAAATALVD